MLKSPFTDAVLTSVDPAGDDIPTRGGDPHATSDGAQGLNPIWSEAPVKTPDVGESANSQSGLPGLPSRMAPSPASPPQPPTLKDRSPMTIDEK